MFIGLLVRSNCRALAYILGLWCLCAWLNASAHADTEVLQRETHAKAFEDVVFDLEFAITQRNLRITGRNDIGRGIRARGVADFPQAIIIHFCSLTLAQKALELAPSLIAHMPCRAAVYDHGDRIAVSTTRLPEDSNDPRIKAFSREINAMLREILDFAVE